MKFKIPEAPNSIQKGVPLKLVLDQTVADHMAANIAIVYDAFDKAAFVDFILTDIDELSLMDRSNKMAEALKTFLPPSYSESIDILLATQTPVLENTEQNGLAPMYYLPYISFISQNGLDFDYNNGVDPFDVSMKAQYELTQRFSAEFSIRNFIIDQAERTFEVLEKWSVDASPHVRRLTSEGSRPRLPWAKKIPSLIADPSPSIGILDRLKDDEDLYVRRSVANHVGDIAKDHLELAFDLCESWIEGASKELKWVIRHAVRHPAKKGNERALEIRERSK